MNKILINRAKMPTKHILVCEDRILMQARIATHLSELLEDQEEVDVSLVRGGIEAQVLISSGCEIDLIILDHDMPNGGGDDLMKWMSSVQVTLGINIPVITASGIHMNNQRLVNLGADYLYDKTQVINGEADETILQILNA